VTETTANLPEDGRILFYRRDREAFGFLSNFASSPMVLDGEDWPTVEHYYQAQKSRDGAYRAAIRATSTPGHAKRLGAYPDLPKKLCEHSWFRTTGRKVRADWPEIKLDVMRQAVRAKFTQNADLAERLRGTGTAEIVEDSRFDSFWGCGADEQGLNWLGRILMEVRMELAG
jgi:N-glycosidase YbiA